MFLDRGACAPVSPVPAPPWLKGLVVEEGRVLVAPEGLVAEAGGLVVEAAQQGLAVQGLVVNGARLAPPHEPDHQQV